MHFREWTTNINQTLRNLADISKFNSVLYGSPDVFLFNFLEPTKENIELEKATVAHTNQISSLYSSSKHLVTGSDQDQEGRA